MAAPAADDTPASPGYALRATLTGHRRAVSAVKFSPDGSSKPPRRPPPTPRPRPKRPGVLLRPRPVRTRAAAVPGPAVSFAAEAGSPQSPLSTLLRPLLRSPSPSLRCQGLELVGFTACRAAAWWTCGLVACRAMVAPAAWWAAALVALGLVGWGAGPCGCGAQPVVLASYGQSRLWLKPYDWSYLRVELPASFSSVTMDFATDRDIPREHLKNLPRSDLAIICLMNANPPIPDISDSYLDSLCLREVKRESSVSFDISKSEMNSSVKRKRVSRVLEINGEHPKKVGIVPDIEDFRYHKIKAKASASTSGASTSSSKNSALDKIQSFLPNGFIHNHTLSAKCSTSSMCI